MRGRFLFSVLFSALIAVLSPHALAGPSSAERLAVLSERIDTDSNNGALYLRRAYTYAEAGAFARAFADLDRAAELGEALKASLLRGELYIRQQEWTAAVEQFDRALAIQPGNTLALLGRGKVYEQLGNRDAAAGDYLSLLGKNVELSIGDVVHIAQFSTAYPKVGAEKALAIIDDSMSAVGVIPQLQYQAIEIEKQRKHFQAAVDRMQTLDASIKMTPQWHVELAEILLLQQNQQSAKYHLDAAEQLLASRRNTLAKEQLAFQIAQMRQRLNTAL